MPLNYRRPGVYLEESLLVNPSETAGTFTVAAFVGAAEKGPVNEPTRVESWSDYVTLFGGFNPISQPQPSLDITTQVLTAPIPANLAALKANPTYGDGHYSGRAFTGGEFVTLTDASKAHVEGATPGATVWSVGPMTGAVAVLPKVLSYLPFALYSFYQNGGRVAYIVRSADTLNQPGSQASVPVNGAITTATPLTSFTIRARSVGGWGNNLRYGLADQHGPNLTETIFTVQVYLKNSEGIYELIETFPNLTVKGDQAGTHKVDAVINDSFSGSAYIMIDNVNESQPAPKETTSPVDLVGGTDPALPDASALTTSATVIGKVEGPINVNIVGLLTDASMSDGSSPASVWVSETVSPQGFGDRSDIFVINDSAPPRNPRQSSTDYIGTITPALGKNPGDSYAASFAPWIIIPHPSRVGATISVPPGGAIMGMISRIDSTVGFFRAPAGVIAGLSNAVGVQTKFTDTELGNLNSLNFNMIRSIPAAGICNMGGRTRKSFGADRYISARRTLIYIKEALKRNTQFAVFENNDQHLWNALTASIDRLLRPLWENGGLKGSNIREAYYITCDGTINQPNIVASGEVRAEVGVALQYPAEFVIIRITQFDQATFTSEVQPVA